MHTQWSDGRDSTEAMVEMCVSLGYEYLAITDHSPHSRASRNLSADGVKRQAEEIAALRERFPQIAILHGCEVDILADGRLDFKERILEGLDIVLASLHEGGGDSPERLLRRYLAAMRHPMVTFITHPTNRLVPHRPGYDLDYDRLFAAAVETGTAVEIDGAPAHLDLDGALARRAIAAGALVVVNSDCHRAELLERQMRLGIQTARRGWVEPRHVLNTQSARRDPRPDRRQTRPIAATPDAHAYIGRESSRRSSWQCSRSFSTARRCCRAWTSATARRFRSRAGSPIITPRDGYPLYFAVGSLFVRATGDDPARALNLASAVLGAAASGLIVVVAAELAGSVIAGAAAALLFAGSYTFWSQAVIAEVYTLHVLLVALTLLLLLRWSGSRPRGGWRGFLPSTPPALEIICR